MQNEKSKKRFLSVRLTPQELKEVYRQCERSTCRSLTEYAKKVLTRKPVIMKVRNESQDELLQAMIGIKNRLDEWIERSEEKSDLLSLRLLIEIKQLTRQIFENGINTQKLP